MSCGIGKKRLKFIHPDGREVVYNGDTHAIMTDGRYKGTFNYCTPYQMTGSGEAVSNILSSPVYYVPYYADKWVLSRLGHGIVDVAPYNEAYRSNTREEYNPKKAIYDSKKSEIERFMGGANYGGM